NGAMLATVALIALMGALWLRRYRAAAPVLMELDETVGLDDAALLDVATVLARSTAQAASLRDALVDVRQHMIHELGAHGVVIHHLGGAADMHLRALDRYPVRDAMQTGAVAGRTDGGFALPVARDGR